MKDKCKLPPEVEEGNIEYKRKLCSLSRYRFQQLQSQMKWRINEGKGVAIYYIGVDDDGTIVKLNSKDRKESIKNLKKIANQIDCYVDSIDYNNYFEIVIKKNLKIIDFYEKRIVFLGNSEVGKSTLISVLSGNDFDNGNGSARLSLFNHKHEMFTGITSSISVETLETEEKKLALIDLPGKSKYKKTKYYGLLSYDPELAVIVIDNKTSFKSIEFIYKILKFIGIPIQLVKTKSDLNTINKSLNKQLDKELNQLIEVSNLTGKNINSLKNKLSFESDYSISKIDNSTILSHQLLDNTTIFQIAEAYYLIDLGLIVSGLLLNGELETDTKMNMGPIKTNNGVKFYEVIITSIHCHQTPYNKLQQDHIGTIVIKFKDDKVNIKNIYNKISKGTYLANYKLDIINQIDVKIKFHDKYIIKENTNVNLFLRNIISDGELISIEYLNKNDFDIKCKIKLSKPSFIRKYDKFILDNNVIKGYGIVI